VGVLRADGDYGRRIVTHANGKPQNHKGRSRAMRHTDKLIQILKGKAQVEAGEVGIDGSGLTAATVTAITNLKAKNWTVTINGVAQ
jgi:hypothetical protein